MVPAETAGRIEESLRNASTKVVEGLRNALRGDSRGIRRAAAALLWWARIPETIPYLCRVLEDEGVADEATQALCAFGREAVAPLLAFCEESDPAARARVFEILPRLGAALATEQLCVFLADAVLHDEDEAASSAARALAALAQRTYIPGVRGVVAALVDALEREGEVAISAALALGAIGARSYEEVRAAVLGKGLAAPSGPYLCRVLGICGRPDDRGCLLAALHDESALLRRAAAEALGALGYSPDAAPALVFALSDESVSVRVAAVRALGTMGAKEALAPLSNLALGTLQRGSGGGEEPAVRAAAIRALGSVGDATVLPLFRKLALDPEGAVATAALEALARLGTDEDVPIFIQALAHSDPEPVKAALRGLAAHKTTVGLRAAAGALCHARWDVRSAAAEALAGSGDPEAEKALVERLKVEEDTLVREALQKALERKE